MVLGSEALGAHLLVYFEAGGKTKTGLVVTKKKRRENVCTHLSCVAASGFGQETATVRAQATKSTWKLSKIKRDKSNLTFGIQDWSLERFFKEVPISPVIGF